MKHFSFCKKLAASLCLAGFGLFIFSCSNMNSPTGMSADQKSMTTAQVNPPWSFDQDIGSCGVAGFAYPSKNLYIIDGAGADIQGTADAFHYVWKRLPGNGTFVAYVTWVDNTNEWAKAGIMIRENLNAGSRNMFVACTQSHGVTSQYRLNTNQGTTHFENGGPSFPYYLKITRTISGASSTIQTYKSANGTNWGTAMQSVTMTNMSGNIYVGMAVTSHNNSVLCQAGVQPISIP